MLEEERLTETRIVIMSPALMKLYNVHAAKNVPNCAPPLELDYQPITFCHPQECLDMLIDVEEKECELEEAIPDPETKAQRMEKQLGELELRLSFFNEAYKWQ